MSSPVVSPTARSATATVPQLPRVSARRDASIGHKRHGFWIETLLRLARDRVAMLGVVIILVVAVVAVLAPVISPHNYTALNATHRLSPPSGEYLLGTDELGRDMFSRLLWGARVSLPVSLVAVVFSTLVGTLIGLMAGYYRGRFDMLAMRCMDVLLAFPSLVLALALLAVLGPDIRNLILALVVSSVPGHARLARGMALTTSTMQYTESARAIGARDGRILWRYVLPNSLSPIIVSASASLGGLILAEAGLSFLGLGIQPPTPSWGMMLNQGMPYLNTAPWYTLWPGLAIFLTVLGFNLLGDGIRDATDPRLRRL